MFCLDIVDYQTATIMPVFCWHTHLKLRNVDLRRCAMLRCVRLPAITLGLIGIHQALHHDVLNVGSFDMTMYHAKVHVVAASLPKLPKSSSPVRHIQNFFGLLIHKKHGSNHWNDLEYFWSQTPIQGFQASFLVN